LPSATTLTGTLGSALPMKKRIFCSPPPFSGQSHVGCCFFW
jgi:hypothetical protein